MVTCITCGSHKVIKCSKCKGIGFINDILCDRCYGSKRLECPICKDNDLKLLFELVLNNIKNLAMFSHGDRRKLEGLVESLFQNTELRTAIKFAQHQSVRDRVNRHDIHHALRVCNYVITLFACFSKYLNEDQFIDEKLSNREILSSLIISAFAHDIKKGMKEHGQMGAITVELSRMLEKKIGLVSSSNQKRNMIKYYISKWIDNHSGKKKVGSIAESLLIIADGLDLQFDRVQPTFDLLFVVTEDEAPGEYFSCKEIVEVKLQAADSLVDCIIRIKGNVAFVQIRELLRRFDATLLGNTQHFGLVIINDCWKEDNWPSSRLRLKPHPTWL